MRTLMAPFSMQIASLPSNEARICRMEGESYGVSSPSGGSRGGLADIGSRAAERPEAFDFWSRVGLKIRKQIIVNPITSTKANCGSDMNGRMLMAEERKKEGSPLS